MTPVNPPTIVPHRRVIAAASLGAMFEWYDFYLYGVLAPVFAAQYFGGDSTAWTVTLLGFAAGFVVRPVGALVFGRLGDLIGRKYTFLATLVLMGGSTFAMGLLPGEAVLGAAAPAVLVLLRLLQGLAIGGEYGGVVTYVAEHAPDDRRGLYTGWIQATASVGLLLALLAVVAVRAALGDAAFSEWGWRLPFLASAVLLAIGVWVRLSLRESPLFLKLKRSGGTSRRPLAEAFAPGPNLRRAVVALFGLVAGQAVVWYTGQFQALYFLTHQLKVDESTAALLVSAALVLASPLFVVFGAWSDRVGRKPIILGGCLLAALVWMPVFSGLEAAVQGGHVAHVQVVLLLLVLMLSVTMVYGPIAALLVEMFPTRVRCSSVSLPYHVGNGWFGGLLPSAMLAVSARTGDVTSGLWVPIGIALASAAIGLVFVRERRGASLDG